MACGSWRYGKNGGYRFVPNGEPETGDPRPKYCRLCGAEEHGSLACGSVVPGVITHEEALRIMKETNREPRYDVRYRALVRAVESMRDDMARIDERLEFSPAYMVRMLNGILTLAADEVFLRLAEELFLEEEEARA